MADQLISDRTTRTTRTFVAHTGPFSALETRINQGGVRCWLDTGEQKQSVRAIYYLAGAESQTVLRFTMRTMDGKHAQYDNDPDEQVTWYEEANG